MTEIFKSLTKILRKTQNANRYALVLILLIISPAFSAPSLFEQYTTWKRLMDQSVPASEIMQFIDHHPKWPAQEILIKKAEKALSGKEDSKRLLSWFEKHPPLSTEGTFLYIKALLNSGKKGQAHALIQKVWAEGDFSAKFAKTFRSLFAKVIRSEDDLNRVNRLLYNEDIRAAQEILPHLNRAQQDLVKTRIALIQESTAAPKKLSETQVFIKNHPGLHYDQIKWYRKQKNNEKAIDLLCQTKEAEEVKYADEWWRERNILARRMIEEKRFEQAFRVIKGHKLTKGENFANAEWLLGWLQLRFLNQPSGAYERFQSLYQAVKSPISRARAAFWAGEAAKALAQIDQANNWHKIGAGHPGTYYGQLSLSQLNAQNPKLAGVKFLRPLSKTPEIQKRFEDRELVKVIKLIPKRDLEKFAPLFVLKLSEALDDVSEKELLVELAHKVSPHSAVQVAKKMGYTHVPMIKSAYPLLSKSHRNIIHQFGGKDPLFASFVHAVIRQESRFNPKALSEAGAQGLMQLMPETAKIELKKISFQKKTAFTKQSLFDPSKNLTVGASHLSTLLQEFNGSLVLAAAAYNAGKKAVKEWIALFGDPRDQAVNVIDWVELIPYGETRNYVERVMENFITYQERFDETPASLYDLGQHLRANLILKERS